jgi:argininosuccinate lyase
MTVLVSGLVADRDRLEEAVSDPLLLATDVAEELVRGGVPFRDAHEQVAASVRDGSFRSGTSPAESVAARATPGPGGVRDAIASARSRFGQGR